jgi:hypothetical protein
MKHWYLLAVWALLPYALTRAERPIEGVLATATSEQVKGLFGAENLCNDKGLRDSGRGDGAMRLTANGYAEGGCMWHSGYLPHGGDENPTVQFDLGKLRTVSGFHVWNYNGQPSRGFHRVSVLVSVDAEVWRPLAQRFEFTIAPKTEDYEGERHRFEPAVRVRYLRFFCDATHRRGGQRELAGLGKLRFFEAQGEPGEETDPGAGVFPAAAGVWNVKLPPFNARGDGVTDDADALQRALDHAQGTKGTLVLPAGEYMVSRPLRLTPGRGYGYTNLRGAGRERTTIRLRDGALTDPARPAALLSMGFKGKEDGSGVHADWFNNNVADLTLDTGRGNPGAIGLRFYSNNVGSLCEVAVRSGDGQGLLGLDLAYADQNGPCLIRKVRIQGFATGVRTGGTVNSQTIEHLEVDASKLGWENMGQCLSIRGLKLRTGGEGFINRFGVVTLIDAEVVGGEGSADRPAVGSGETIFVRNLRTRGFARAIDNLRKGDAPTPGAQGPDVSEWVSSAPLSLFPAQGPRSLGLPVLETPASEAGAPQGWVNVRAWRRMSDLDDSASLQRAIDSGAQVVYFPKGGPLYFGEEVELRGPLHTLVGLHTQVHGAKGPARWKLGAQAAKRVELRDLTGEVHVEHAGPGTLVVRNGQGTGGVLAGGGDLFLENVTADWAFRGGRAWARQLNNEREGLHLDNSGAALWVLGLKTERGGTLIRTGAGAATELLGGLSYTTTQGKLGPMFESTDARVSYVLGEVCYTGDPYAVLVRETRGGVARELKRGAAPLRASFLQGSELPLYVGAP